jgi:hypothetical protein
MQRSAYLTAALLTSAVALNSACNDLGTCDDPARGRTTVATASGGPIFTGQAIINKSCAPCHGSTTKGAGRQGAPAGLDFDLFPLTGTMTVPDSSGGIQGVKLDPTELAGLRTRQRKVYDERESIWQQVEKGLMPPTSTFESLSVYFESVFGSDGKCTKGASLTDLKASREDFRQWLACDVPIIEATSDQLPYKPVPAGAKPPDAAAGAAYYSIPGVSVGYQYPSCVAGGSSGGTPGFDEVYNKVLAKDSNLCLACHGGTAPMGMFDIGTVDKAWTTLMGANGMGTGMTTCAKHPVYVKPNDPDNSYILNMVVVAKERCTPSVMPQGSTTGLPAADVALITSWIMGGAPRTATSGSGGGGSDAGVDAGRDAAF